VPLADHFVDRLRAQTIRERDVCRARHGIVKKARCGKG